MKQFFTNFLFLTLAMQMHAQVTITNDNFTREAGFIDSFYINFNAMLPSPTLGDNQVWDYSQLNVEAELQERTHFDATGNTEFPDALNYRNRTISFQGLLIDMETYEIVNDDAFYDVGRVQLESSYSITAITGGADDIITFVEEKIEYDGQINFLQFPVQYEDEWTTTRIEYFPFELTVAAFGLDNTPGRQQRATVNTREVVGYGDLIIPDEDGNPSNPIASLLINISQVETDSTFLGGAPAPPSIVAAFGLEQGSTVEKEAYIYYAPNFGTPIADIEEGRFLYRKTNNMNTSATEVYTIEGKAFPNPIAAGEAMNFQLTESFNKGTFRLTDLAGKAIFETTIKPEGQNSFSVDFSNKVNTGMYFYQLENEAGELMRPRLVYVK